MKKAFTLIELLVVVLIIGILAAVALPQYEKAVVKTRYNTMKILARSLLNAAEVYFMANGEYTNDKTLLDIEAPEDAYITCGLVPFNQKTNVEVICTHSQIGMRYQIYSPSSGSHDICVALNTDTSSVQAQVCKQETGRTTPRRDSNESLLVYEY